MKIFLSYPIQDVETARLIAEELEKSGYKVWAFFNEVPKFNPDHSLLVQEGIESADLILVLVSQHYKASKGVPQEIIYAQYRNKPILPIMIEPTKVPFSLLGTQYLDISDDLSAGYWRIIEAIRQHKIHPTCRARPIRAAFRRAACSRSPTYLSSAAGRSHFHRVFSSPASPGKRFIRDAD